MNTIYKRVRFPVYFFRPLNRSNCPKHAHTYSTGSTKLLAFPELKSISMQQVFVRHLYSSGLTKSNDSDSKVDESPQKAVNRKALEDADFQNILKDFAKDFDVGHDSTELLEDIKKQIEETEPIKKDLPLTKKDDTIHDSSKNVDTAAAIKEKFKEFTEFDSVVIHSFEDFQTGSHTVELPYHIDQEMESDFPMHDMKRGVSGVFDIDEMVEVLNKEKLRDIAVISIPKELHYADFLVIVSSRSLRHAQAVTEFLLKLYKKKKGERDPFVIVEGEKLSDWKVIDMGNIVLHIFSEEMREFYDIESLWLFDSAYDGGGTLQPDPVFEAIKEQMAFFESIEEVPTDNTPIDKLNSK